MPRTLIAGAILVLAGLAFWALYALQAGQERHAYTHGGAPPTYVRLVSGHTYWLSIPGGTQSETEQGLDPSTLQCTAAAAGQAPGALPVAAQANSKAIDQIASFTSAFTGMAHIECTGVGAVYVDDAADAPFDWSGTWLILATLALLVGVPLTLSALRRGPDYAERDDAEGERDYAE
jgi:hypothetical protein